MPDCQPVRLPKLNFLKTGMTAECGNYPGVTLNDLYKTLFTKFLNLIGQSSKAGARNVTN